MMEKRTWYVVVGGVLDNRVGYLDADEDAALAMWRSSTRYEAAREARRSARAVPRDGLFSIVDAKTRRPAAPSDTGLSLSEALARYWDRTPKAGVGPSVQPVLIGDDRRRAVTVGRNLKVWSLTFKPLPVVAHRSGRPHGVAYYLLYQERPGGLLHEQTDIYGEAEAEAAVREALRSALVGSYAVAWRAIHQEHVPWQSWVWERWRSYLKTTPRDVIRVSPVMALSAIPRQRYLDPNESDPTRARRYSVITDIDVEAIGDKYRATGMHVGQTYEGWGKSERAAVKALKAAIEAADPEVQITRARKRR